MSDFECIELNSVDEVSVVKFRDERIMDPTRIEVLGTELLSVLDQDAENFVVNFENVRFFSSAAVNKLIVFEKRIRANGGQMKLSSLRPEVRDLFKITNLDSIFDIRDGQSDAIASINQ